MQDDVLEQFEDLIVEFEGLQRRIQKIRRLEARMPTAVYDRLRDALEHESTTLLTRLLPRMVDVEDEVTEIAGECNRVRKASAKARERIQEVELRELIGEASNDETREIQEKYGELARRAEERLGELADAIDARRDPLQRWETLGQAADILLDDADDDLVLD